MEDNQKNVHLFWNNASCGEELFLKGESDLDKYLNEAEMRYSLEPEIMSFANFTEVSSKRVLEIGVGLGADHQNFALNGAELYGIDLTERAISHTRRRLNLFGLSSTLKIADAENLPFSDDFFDVIYSWGVIHHSTNTEKAVTEIFRTLKNGGEARIMIYNYYSMVGFMLWIRYALFTGNLRTTLSEIYDKYLESPGTKAYRKQEVLQMFSKFSSVSISSSLSHADLLTSDVGQRHRGLILKFARIFYPRFIVRSLFSSFGLFLTIKAIK